MHYYEVLVSSQQYHGKSALTYRYAEELGVGTIVIVPLQRQTVSAVVLKEVPKPKFTTKDILRTAGANPAPRELPQLLDWLKDYYPAPLGQITSLAFPKTLTAQSRHPQIRNTSSGLPQPLPPLTTEQTLAVASIRKAGPDSVLLHGDTGTGKTRIYLELIKEELQYGRSTLLLTPEIGLTPQLATACQKAFPDKTIIMHSELTAATRRNSWLQILEANGPLIVIGPRSALFTPLKTIGLIVIDEFHEGAYKQEQAPHYLASRVAAKLASLHGAQLILGSATPLITDYFTFQKKQLPIIRMQEPAIRSEVEKAHVEIVDLKKREYFTRSPWLSNQLIEAIEHTLRKKQQTLLFLNRRGTARLILCQTCGWQGMCPRCDLPLTYHGDRHIMQCHTCGYSDKVPHTCANCGTNDIIFRSIGTKSLVLEVERLFPDAVVKRFDGDTAKAERLEEQYAAVRNGAVDILVGTQVLGKGLDLPRLSVLGVVLADTSLSFPDYTAEERTFQLLTQVIGRVHRGHIQGSAFIQTHRPENLILRAAISKDYLRFYKAQLIERKLYGFPPFRYMLKLTCTRANQASAKRSSEQLANQLRKKQAPIEVVGPGPAFIEKVADRYRWQLLIKTTQRPELIKIIKELPANWAFDIDPTNLL